MFPHLFIFTAGKASSSFHFLALPVVDGGQKRALNTHSYANNRPTFGVFQVASRLPTQQKIVSTCFFKTFAFRKTKKLLDKMGEKV